jgi:hypothetical protein
MGLRMNSSTAVVLGLTFGIMAAIITASHSPGIAPFIVGGCVFYFFVSISDDDK